MHKPEENHYSSTNYSYKFRSVYSTTVTCESQCNTNTGKVRFNKPTASIPCKCSHDVKKPTASSMRWVILKQRVTNKELKRKINDRDGERDEQRGLACREVHQRMRLSFRRRRRYICGRNERKQQKVSLCKLRGKRPRTERDIIANTNWRGDF